MKGLEIIRCETETNDGGVEPDAWSVSVFRDGHYLGICHGFGERIDAEIALQFLLSLPIDWTGDRKTIVRQCKAAGYHEREDLQRAACERLRW